MVGGRATQHPVMHLKDELCLEGGAYKWLGEGKMPPNSLRAVSESRPEMGSSQSGCRAAAPSG